MDNVTVSIRIVSVFANHWISWSKVNKLKRHRVSCKTCRHSKINDHKILCPYVCRKYRSRVCVLFLSITFTVRSLRMRVFVYFLFFVFLLNFAARKFIVSHFLESQSLFFIIFFSSILFGTYMLNRLTRYRCYTYVNIIFFTLWINEPAEILYTQKL